MQRFFDWLFATDRQCNRFAVARRIGIMYMIWNHRMFRMYDTDRGWAPYSGSSPHTDHVHISLTRDGGSGRVSYYNPIYQAPRGWTPERHRVKDTRVGSQWEATTPLSGDFDGDGLDDLLWYNPGAGPDRKWQGQANRTFRSVEETINGTFEQQVVGDFNGDRADDIVWYNPGEGEDKLWRGTAYGFLARNFSMGGDYEPFPGDFDGDFRDDVFWYGPGTASDTLSYGNADGFTSHNANYAGDRDPVPGDYNGDDRTDILWYGVGELSDKLWTGGRNRGFTGYDVDAARPYASAIAADIDGDTFDDLFWHASPDHDDRFWTF